MSVTTSSIEEKKAKLRRAYLELEVGTPAKSVFPEVSLELPERRASAQIATRTNDLCLGAVKLSKPQNKKRSKKGGGGFAYGAMLTKLVSCPKYPPSYNAVPTYRCKRRWKSSENTALDNTFYTADGHQQFLEAVSSTDLVCFADCWRIAKISVWSINYVDNGTTVSIIPVTSSSAGDFAMREAVYEASSRSEAMPGSLSIETTPFSRLGSWHKCTSPGDLPMFVIRADYGGASSGNWATVTLDIDFEFVVNLYGGPQSYTATTSSAVVGSLGGANLKNNGGGTSMLLQGINILLS